MIKYTLCSLVLIFVLVSCKDDDNSPITDITPDQLAISVQPVFGAESIEPDSVYTTVEGYDVKFTEIKFYFSPIANDGYTLADAALYDWASHPAKLTQVNGDKANFSSINGNLGVAPSNNHADPAAFAPANPLNISIANDMHWDWNPGYIFMKVEAKVDTIPDGIPLFDHNVVFHIGTDANLQTLSFEDINWVTLNEHLSLFSLKLDLATFLQNSGQNIDLKTEYTSHSAPGQESLSLKVIQNFKAALQKL